MRHIGTDLLLVRSILLLVALFFLCNLAFSQTQDTLSLKQIINNDNARDTTKVQLSLKEQRRPDVSSLGNSQDTLGRESQSRRVDRTGESIPPMEAQLTYGADSSTNDIANGVIHLYGNAYVRYEEFEVTSDYIIFDVNANEVEATMRPLQRSKPSFKSGDQNVTADRLRYNIDTEKGIVYGARVIQNDLFVHGAVSKFVKAGSDSLHIDDVVYNRNALITTCDAEHPHWGIRTTKLKLIPDKIAIIGPANMELAGIPLPLVLPFAFAPLFDFSQGTSGLIFPQDPFYRSPDLGLGVRGLGYYFAISDKLDLSARADIYTRGSWGLTLNSNYKKRYKHNGSINLAFSRQLQEIQGDLTPNAQNSYSISFNHNQDSKAHPYRNIGGSLRFTVNDFDRRNFEAASAQLNSQINSNFNYNYKITDKLNFSSSINHSQNTQNRDISFTLPQVQLRMNRIFPFKRKGGSLNGEKWYEKINVQYDGKFQNKIATKDTLLFTKETLESFRAGFTHQIDAGASYNLFDYVTFNTNINYDEFWYLHTTEYELNDVDSLVGFVQAGFKPLRDMNVSANLTTNVFGTLAFAKGWLRGLRHQMTPSIGVSFKPSTLGYFEYFDQDPTVQIDRLFQYNPFQAFSGSSLFNNQSLSQGGFSINYGITNTFEGKYFSKKDSTEHKFKIFNTVNLNGSYNVNLDSLNWSPVSVSANARILNGLSNLSINGSFDPYQVNENGTRINQTVISAGKGLLRLDNISAGLSTSFSFKQIRDFFRGDDTGESDFSSPTDGGQTGERRNSTPSRNQKKTGNDIELFSWFEGFRIQHNYRASIRTVNGVQQFQTDLHTIQIATQRIPLTDKWGMQINSLSYDFKNSRFVYPSFTLTRDLHCWQMSISWQPQNDTYSFFIGVKAAPFSDFLKIQSGRNQFDNRFR